MPKPVSGIGTYLPRRRLPPERPCERLLVAANSNHGALKMIAGIHQAPDDQADAVMLPKARDFLLPAFIVALMIASVATQAAVLAPATITGLSVLSTLFHK
jgi:hypothetical protein